MRLAGLTMLWCGLAAAQTRPVFEAASVKPSDSMSVRHVLLPPVGGRLSTRMAPLRLLIQSAYGVQSFQISGGPNWMDSAGYDIEAKASGNPSRSEVWLMLQSLLEDRFQLKVHREARVMPVYVLTTAKGVPSLSEAADCTVATAPNAQRPPGPCGSATVSFDQQVGIAIIGRQVTMQEFARQLGAILQRPVIDRSEFLGKFDVDLRFSYDPDVTVGLSNPWGQSKPDPSGSPSITAALPRQLGLKLETSKAPVEMLLVDHVEKPSGN